MSLSTHSWNGAGSTESDSSPLVSPETSGGSGPNSGNYMSLSSELLDEDPQLVQPNNKYECPVCIMSKNSHRLLRNPVQTRCGHRICETCVEVYLGKEISKICPMKEEDCEQVTRTTVFPDPGCRREMRQLLVYCGNRDNGCQEKVKFSSRAIHQTECEFRKVTCDYLTRGCTVDVIIKELQEHLTACEYRPVICELCGMEYSFNFKVEHDSEICPEAIVRCPYSCEILNLKRKKLEDHKTVCPRKPEECRFKSLGCTFTGSKAEIKSHEKDSSIHFLMCIECFTSFKIQANEQQKEIEDCRHLQTELKLFEQRIESQVKTIHSDLRLKLVQQVERMIIAERKIDELGETFPSLIQDSHNLQQSAEQLKALIPQVTNHDRQLAGHGIKMAEMDLRFQMMETANYNGTLIWKVSDFSKRKKDAVEGRTTSLYSQPFYTGRFGYKMCARLYPNGDGIGRGTHMSLYFVVMKGEYDALLSWPFQCKVSLILLDQSPQKRHLKDEFIPDPASTSFKRPFNAEMNVASGCPLFVAHTVLENHSAHYIKDDVLFIKVFIDTTNIQPI